MITQEQAHQIAEAYLRQGPATIGAEPLPFVSRLAKVLVADVRDGASFDRPLSIYGFRYSLAECWLAYLSLPPAQLQSSTVVIISKTGGDVLYYGLLNDEG